MLESLRTGPAPGILIVGGGINGVGTFRDLAAQGVPSLLVEAGDFASGTSAAPSRLIHGGLRYLETGEAALVRESLLERNLLLRNARHVVHPQPVWIPLRSWFGGSLAAAARLARLKKTPGRKGAVPVAIGLMVYDLFGRELRSMPTHRMIGAAEAHRAVPALSPGVKAVAEFHDARISHPERLVLELVADAEADCPDAMAIPYLAAGMQRDGHVTLHDRLTGQSLSVAPRVVVNASGAWVDRVQGDLGIPGRLMGGTRGTHLVMRNPALSRDLGGRMLYFETSDHRACLALPLDAAHVYVGTTDIRTDDPDDRRYTEAEIDYIFDVLRPVLPDVDWRPEDIVFVMAGVRPLPFQDAGVKAAGAISRDHRVDGFPAVAGRPFETFTLVGGKWTTYRALAEQAADRVLAHLGTPRQRSTRALAIGGARDFPQDPSGRRDWARALAARTGLGPDRCAELAGRYGSHACAFAEAERGDPRAFGALKGYTPAEIGLICRSERVSRLEDVVLRRTLMAFEGRTGRAALEEVAEIAAVALGWDNVRRDREVANVVALLQDEHRVAVT
ncbi:glycerol-3-phosphate dehydrogenase/oxidase [Rhodovulum euryhalinum]|uniref:glycerol-3-phosphate dehydrogenase/oxidase n=1 Tax=Rhodovulum euryhalinum TaxID=35805 RepID=UPI001FB3A1B6|nr:glycerol-3-phosphate dehydrogenase/oxidase [Rhodovulum euryhalinum]